MPTKKRADMTEEEKQNRREYERKWWANRTEEQKKRKVVTGRASRAKRNRGELICDNPQCGKVFVVTSGPEFNGDRQRKYCGNACSNSHIVGRCSAKNCDKPINSMAQRRSGLRYDLCSKHRKAEQRKIRNALNRSKMFDLMGGKCVCCGQSDPIYFQVDHVHNDADYSGTRGHAGSIQLSQYLKEPDRFQLLCANCNYAKRMNGGKLYTPRS